MNPLVSKTRSNFSLLTCERLERNRLQLRELTNRRKPDNCGCRAALGILIGRLPEDRSHETEIAAPSYCIQRGQPNSTPRKITGLVLQRELSNLTVTD
jgi:hypothetical protein